MKHKYFVPFNLNEDIPIKLKLYKYIWLYGNQRNEIKVLIWPQTGSQSIDELSLNLSPVHTKQSHDKINLNSLSWIFIRSKLSYLP